MGLIMRFESFPRFSSLSVIWRALMICCTLTNLLPLHAMCMSLVCALIGRMGLDGDIKHMDMNREVLERLCDHLRNLANV